MGDQSNVVQLQKEGIAGSPEAWKSEFSNTSQSWVAVLIGVYPVEVRR